MQMFTEAKLSDIMDYWAKDYEYTGENYDVKVVRYSVDQSTGKVLFVLEKTEKVGKDV